MRTRKRPRRTRSTAGAVLQFALGGMAALALITLGAVIVLRHAGKNEAIRDARTESRVIASSIIEPVLKDREAGSEAARLAEASPTSPRSRSRQRVSVRVELWDRTGRILYSDEPRLIDRQYDLEADDLAVLEHGGSTASVTDLSAPENQFEPRGRSLLQVYRQVHTADGKPLLLETYFPYRSVTSGANRIIREFAPIAIGAMVLLALIQIPRAVDGANRGVATRTGGAARARRRRLDHRTAAHRRRPPRRRGAGPHRVSFSIVARSRASTAPPRHEWRESLQDAAEGTRRGIRQLVRCSWTCIPRTCRAPGSRQRFRISSPGCPIPACGPDSRTTPAEISRSMRKRWCSAPPRKRCATFARTPRRPRSRSRSTTAATAKCS